MMKKSRAFRAFRGFRALAPSAALFLTLLSLLSLLPRPASSAPPVPAAAAEAPAPAAAPAAAPPLISGEARRILNRANGYFQRIRHLQGKFFQTNADGSRAEGVFYLRRPWRMRFEYTAPGKMLVIADGTWLIVRESPSRAAQRYPLASTPVRFLLAPEIDVVSAARILRAERKGDQDILHLASKLKDAPGEIALHFRREPFALDSWTVIDPQGLRTRVMIRDLREGVKARNALFRVLEKDPFSRRR